MSSIGQGPVQTDQAAANSQVLNTQTDNSEAPVKRGFSDQNSYSRVAGEETVKSQVPKPRLDSPDGSKAESTLVSEEIIKGLETSKDETQTESLGKSVREFAQKPLAQGAAALKNNKNELLKQGFSESQIDGLTDLADPNGEKNGLPPLHSSSARVDSKLQGSDKLDNLFNVFTDVIKNYSSIKSIPPNLQEELDSELKTFTQKALNSKYPLDVDSATTMLVQIQTKLQNNRIIFDQESIKIDQVAKEQSHIKQMKNIMESIEKVKKSEQSGLIGKIFGWIAVAVMAVVVAVVAVVGAVFTGGALTVVAVSLMVASLAIVVTMMASQEAGSTWMMDMFGDSKEGKIGAMVFWTALIVALSIGGAVAGGFAGGAAGAGGAAASSASSGASTGASAASTGATVSATAANVAATASSTTAKVTNALSNLTRILQLVNGATMVGEGAASIANSVYRYEADTLKADAHAEKAFLLRIQQSIDDATESLQKAIDELQAGYSTAASIIKANHETKTQLLSKLRG